MINTCQTISEADCTEPFEDRIDILYRELELAIKWQRPSVLLAIYGSEYVHADADIALENHLADLGQRAYHIKIKTKEDADVISLVSELANLQNVVFFIEGLRWGAEEGGFDAYRNLNKHREFFIENQVRVVFWLTENEAVDLAHYAPDCWAFRHRVIEFVDPPRTEQISPPVLESAWQGVGEFSDTIDDLDAKIAFRTALLTDLPDGNESTATRANLLLTLGILHWRRGDYEKATQFLNSTLKLAEKLQDNFFEALCYNAIALVETDLGRYDEAIQAYQCAIELAPERIYPWNNLGNLYCKLEQYEEALKAFQKAIEQNANDVVSWNGLGDIYQKLGRNDDAIYAYLKTIELVPDYAHSWSSLGKSYATDGRLEDAFAAHQKALGINRHIVGSWIGLGEINRRQGRDEDAINAYQTAIELDPKNGQAWNELGHLYYNAKSDDKAVCAYQKAIELDRACSHSYNNLASIQVQKGHYAEVVPLLQKGIELAEDAAGKMILWNRLGDAYRRLDDYDNAIAAYRKADQMDPKTAAPQDELPATESDSTSAPLEASLDNLPTSSESHSDEIPASEPLEPTLVHPSGEAPRLDNTARTQPEVPFVEWLNGLGTMLPASEQLDVTSPIEPGPAEIEKTEEFKTSPEAPSTAAENLELEAACWVFKDGKPDSQKEDEAASNVTTPFPVILGSRILSDIPVKDDAVPASNQVLEPVEAERINQILPQNTGEDENIGQAQIEIDEKNAQIWNELGNIYFKAGSYDEANHAFEKAIELDPSSGWPYNNLASIYVHKGQYAEAIPLYQKGISLLNKAKDKALLWNRLGDAYRRLDDPDNAMSAYEKAMELDPDKASLLTRARFSLLGNCRA